MEHQLPSFPAIFASLFFIFLATIAWKKTKNKHRTPNLPPGPRELPVIGNMHQLAGSMAHHRLRDLARKYGSIMHLKLGEVKHIIISSPEAANEVMKAHDIIFAQRPHNLAASIITYNYTDIAFAPYGEYWRQVRKIAILELLSVKRVQSFRSIREEEVSNLIRMISSTAGVPFNFSKKLYSLTYGIAGRASFGKKCKEQNEFISAVEEITVVAGGFSLADFFPSVKLLQVISGMKSTVMRLFREVDRILGNIIEDHRARKKTSKSSGEGENDDLVDVLLKLQETLEFPLTNDNIKAVVLDIFIAGSETSSTTVEWAMSELLKNPRALKKAQAEVRKVFEDEGNVNEAGLEKLKYLKLVIKETLRLHPPVPLLLPRESRERCEIKGYEIPANYRVIVNAWAIGRDPNAWTEAETFYPERFLDKSVDFKGNNFEFIPFGAGRRMCPGMAFGIANVELPLAQFLYHFDWKLPNGITPETFDMDENFGSTVRRKNDLHLIPIPYKPLPVGGSC